MELFGAFFPKMSRNGVFVSLLFSWLISLLFELWFSTGTSSSVFPPSSYIPGPQYILSSSRSVASAEEGGRAKLGRAELGRAEFGRAEFGLAEFGLAEVGVGLAESGLAEFPVTTG